MGQVYSAEDTLVRSTVALKVIHPEYVADPDSRARLIRELRMARLVTSPHVCRLYDIAETCVDGDSLLFLTMELLHGETLSERLRRLPRLTFAEARALTLQLAEALATLHGAGVVHRDFKPANVMLTVRNGATHAVVMDFGLAQPVLNQNASASVPHPSEDPLTKAGKLTGTPAYMAPEQAACGLATPASDVFAFGLVITRMVTGLDYAAAIERPAAGGARPTLAASAVLKHAGRPWPELGARGLRSDPAGRYASGAALRDAIVSRPRRTAWRLGMAVAAASVVLAAGLTFRWFGQEPIPAERHVAVMPFRQVAGSTLKTEALDGASEALSRKLAGCCTSATLWFLRASEVKAVRAGPSGKAERDLGVNLLLTGDVFEASGRLRVNLTLRDATTRRALRTAAVPIGGSDLSAGERAISAKAAELLGVTLAGRSAGDSAAVAPGALQFREAALSYSTQYDDQSLAIAIALLRKSVAADPRYGEAHADLARALLARYDLNHDARLLDEAAQSCGRAVQSGGESASLLLAEAQIAQKRNDTALATNLLGRALELEPRNADVLFALAKHFDNAGRTLNAQQTYEKALEAHPGDWRAYSVLGNFYKKHGLYSEAEKNFRAARELAPDNPTAILNLGALLIYEHKFEEAEVLLRHGVELRPTAGGYSNLGSAVFFAGKYTEAVEAFTRAAALAPADDVYRRNLGDAYLRLNNLPKAGEAYSQAVDLVTSRMRRDPGDAKLAGSRALYLARCGRKAEALAPVRAALHGSAGAELLFRCAVAMELCGNRAEALRILKESFARGLASGEAQASDELDQLRKDPRYLRMLPPETATN